MITDMAGANMLITYWAMFRINAIVMHWVPSQNVASTQSTSLLSRIPTLGWCVDLDDAQATADLGLWQERSDWKQRTFDRPISFKFVPAVSTELYTGIASSGYGVKQKAWIRMANSSVKHYGIKWALYGTPADQVISMYTWYKFYLTIRGLL